MKQSDSKNKKVFLGGTCNESKWRDNLISRLKIDYFDPVVDDWTPAHQAIELEMRKTCDFLLYTITPKMTGVYSVAEVVDDSNKRPEKTIFVLLKKDGSDKFNEGQLRSLQMVSRMVKENGAKCFNSIESVAAYLNSA